MQYQTIVENRKTIAVIESIQPVITDVTTLLDLIATVRYEQKSNLFAIRKESLPESFFILSTGLAGEILQKFVTYGAFCAIYGDFSQYSSKPLQDFIRESNRTNGNIRFAPSLEAAAAWLASKE